MAELSVIVNAYNNAPYIQQTINSLLNCSIDLEIIVIDDSSSDNTVDLVNELVKERENVRVFVIEDQGVSHARNVGVSKVETAYFTFLDGDDYVEPTFYERLLAKMKLEDSDIGFGNFRWIYEDSNKTTISKERVYSDKKDCLINMYAVLWNKIYRTSWFKSLDMVFNEGHSCEDTELLYRLLLHMDKRTYLDEIAVNYLQHSGSGSRRLRTHIEDSYDSFNNICQYYKKMNKYEEYKDELEYLFARYYLGNCYLKACNIEDKEERLEVLNNSYEFLITHFPNYKENKYLKEAGKKNLYFRSVNKNRYYKNVKYFRLAHKLGLLQQ